MSKILTKEDFEYILREYYLEHYGENENDVWYDKPAVNVCVFKRDNRFISLKSHVINGSVTEFVEEIND